MEHTTAYGLWPLVVINSLLFIAFAFSFTHPPHIRWGVKPKEVSS